MKNKKKKSFSFNMNLLDSKIILLLLAIFSLAHSIPSEDLEAVYRENNCQEGECEVIGIELSSRYKRSAIRDSKMSFPLKAFGHERMINLVKSDKTLVGHNPPVYFTRSTSSGVHFDKKYGLFSSKLYQDDANLAAFMLSDDSGVRRIKSGYIASENLLISKLTENRFRKFSNGSRKHHYLARSMRSHVRSKGISDVLRDGVGRKRSRPDIPIPEIVYPEVLVIVDYDVYKRFDRASIIPYLLQFWSGVDVLFNQLENPKYKLSIGGVIVAEDEDVFEFLRPSTSWDSTTNVVDYRIALKRMSKWLKREESSIPFDSYDVYMIMTPYLDGIDEPTSAVGMATIESVCHGKNANFPEGGIIYEPDHFQGIIRAAHELGHTFGAEHDDEGQTCGQTYIMSSKEANATKWSRCSIRNFKESLKTVDFSCMYNKPKLNDYHSDVNSTSNEDYTELEDFHVEITSDRNRLTTNYTDFDPEKLVEIYYDNNTLIITQVDSDESSTEPFDEQDLQIVVLDEDLIIMDPGEINPLKKVKIFHEDQYIYVYQGKKPKPDHLESNSLPLLPHFFESDDSIMCFVKTDFIKDKLVKIHHNNNKIYVSQRNILKNKSPNKLKGSYLQYKGSHFETFYFDPSKINWDKEICVKHDINSLFVYQGTAGSNSVDKKSPKPDEKLVSEFDTILEPENLLSVYSNEFNQSKLVSISFENNKLKVTQMNTPEEKKRENTLPVSENLIIVTSDLNKLLLHPRRINSNKEILITHNNKLIKVWQGDFDAPPSHSFSQSDAVEIITPEKNNKESQASVEDVNIALNSEEILEIYPNEFNPKKSVSVAFKDNELQIMQANMPLEEPYNGQGYKNYIRIIKPDSMKLELHPVRIDSMVMLKICHKNGKIYIWHGSDLPTRNSYPTNIVRVLT